ncbi:MAG TPA: NAD(P)-dependent oxidoreductase [Spirochaetia bacterium]|nr:NAD(P)-dependent oxidoreductase [Spirochaetia bacterium]
MAHIAVTGGSGKLGTWVLPELADNGHDVWNVDTKPPADERFRTRFADLNNLGEVYGALRGADLVVHLAAIPVAFLYANEVTFRNNVVATYNVFEAAAGLGIRRIVHASSETIYGIGFAEQLIQPNYLPLDEDHPLLPEDPYGLSKLVGEKTAESFNRRTGIEAFCLRFGYIHTPEMIRTFPSFNRNPHERVRNLWNYIDVRDAAVACRLAAETDKAGYSELNIVADETCMDVKSRDLVAALFPGVTDIREPLTGYEGLMSNRRAHSLLGWNPTHRWRDAQ